jgi:hypothetical protein
MQQTVCPFGAGQVAVLGEPLRRIGDDKGGDGLDRALGHPGPVGTLAETFQPKRGAVPKPAIVATAPTAITVVTSTRNGLS